MQLAKACAKCFSPRTRRRKWVRFAKRQQRKTHCPQMQADEESTRHQDKLGSFCKIPPTGTRTPGDAAVSTNRLIRRRLRYGNDGIEARGRHLVGRKQGIPRPDMVMQVCQVCVAERL